MKEQKSDKIKKAKKFPSQKFDFNDFIKAFSAKEKEEIFLKTSYDKEFKEALLAKEPDIDSKIEQMISRSKTQRTYSGKVSTYFPLRYLGPTEPTLLILFKEVLHYKASDLHIAEGYPPAVRINGDIKYLSYPVLTTQLAEDMLLPLLLPEQQEIFNEKGYLDFSYEEPGVARFRVTVYKHYYGLGAAFRYIPERLPVLGELGLPPILEEMADYKKGLVLITGPTGSGKSTTLAAIINHINQTRKAHIITIEDPLEFIHSNIKSKITHREISHHASSFSDAINSALRADPDIILVGEMRDLETISQVLRAAETGVLVLSTLHTNTAAKAIDRMLDIFPPDQQSQISSMLSESLRAVVAQQLIKTTNKYGRCAATEILIKTPALANLIREGKTSFIESLIQTGREYDMHSMDQSLIELVKSKKISTKDALEKASDLHAFERAGISIEE